MHVVHIIIVVYRQLLMEMDPNNEVHMHAAHSNTYFTGSQAGICCKGRN